MLAFFLPQPIGGGVRCSLTRTLPQALHLLPGGQHKGGAFVQQTPLCPFGTSAPLGLGMFHAEAGVYRLPRHVSFFHSYLGEHSKPLL